MEVGDLSPRERVERLVLARVARTLPGALDRVGIDGLRLVVLAQIVAEDGEVERRLDVGRVDLQRLLERVPGRFELAQLVVGHAQHVVHVGKRRAAGDHLLQMAGGKRPVAAREVFPTEGDQLPQMVVHAPPAATRWKRSMDAQEVSAAARRVWRVGARSAWEKAAAARRWARARC